MMRFDENGNRLRSVCVTHRTHYTHDVVEEDLSSKFVGISDKSIQIVREMVKDEDMNKLNDLLKNLVNITKCASC